MLIYVEPGGNPDKVTDEVRRLIDFGRVTRAGHCVLVEFDDVPGHPKGGAFNETLVARLRQIDHVSEINISDHEMAEHFCPWRT
jgi:hypothetical protein